MIRRFLVLIASFAAIVLPADVLAASNPAPPATAVFAGGCFWCMESDMRGIPGVLKVESGYTGGHVARPSYEDVTSERSGHYESVRVTYDPAKLDYGFLLYKYWKLVDPTDDGGQFCDRGPSYRPPCSSPPTSARSPRSPAPRPQSA